VIERLWVQLLALSDSDFRQVVHVHVPLRVQMVEYWTRTSQGHLQAALSKLLTYCAQANSVSYPQRDRKWVVADAIWGKASVADWGGGISVMLHCRSNCLLSQAIVGRIKRHSIMSSCQSAATSEIVKRCWSWVYHSCKLHYSKYLVLYLLILSLHYTFTISKPLSQFITVT